MSLAALASFTELGARDGATDTVLSRGESIGLAFDTLAGVSSAIAAASILLFIFFRIHRDGWSSWDALDASVVSLFTAEVIQGIGHALDLKWVIQGGAETGSYCTAQGLMQQLGETSVALATLTIGIQTFLTIWWLKYLNRTISVLVILVEFIFIVLFVGIGFGLHTHPGTEYYSIPGPYWCWIGYDYTAEQIAGEYVWFFLALFLSLLLYIPLFLLYCGIIRPGTSWYSPEADLTWSTLPQREGAHGDDQHSNQDLLSRGSLQLWSTILYPVLYCVLILPTSVVRLRYFHLVDTTGHAHTGPTATFIPAIIFTLSGVFNSLLYSLTRSRFFRAELKEEPGAPALRMDPISESMSTKSTASGR